MRRVKIIPFLILFAAVSWGCQSEGRNNEARNNPPPADLKEMTVETGSVQLTLDGIDGKPIKLSDYAGKIILIDVWDTWCPPCKKGIPEFIELQDEYRDKGVVILGIAGGRFGLKAVQDFAREYGMNYPVALVNQSVIEELGSIQSIPTAFLLDKDHKVIQRYVGYRPKTVFAADIERLLENE